MLDASGGHISIDLLLRQIGYVFLAEVATVGCHPSGFGTTQVRLESLHHRFEFPLVVGLLADPSGNNHLAMAVNSRLTVIALLKGLGCSILHDPRLRIRKVVLSLPIGLLRGNLR